MSMVKPEHGDGGEVPALVEVEDQDREPLVSEVKRMAAADKLAHDGYEDEAPGGDQGRPEQRDGDVAATSQARGRPGSARFFHLGDSARKEAWTAGTAAGSSMVTYASKRIHSVP